MLKLIKYGSIVVLFLLIWSFYSSKFEFYFPRTSQEAKLFASNEWMVNKNVLQYSAIMSVVQNRIEIESLVHFNDWKNRRQDNNGRCVIKLANNSLLQAEFTLVQLIEHHLTHFSDNFTAIFFLHKVKCFIKLDNQPEMLQIGVAVIHLADYLNISLVSNFQKPVQIERPAKKRKSIVNCVQPLRKVDQVLYNNTLIWLKINKAIGVDKVRLCAIEHQNELVKKLKLHMNEFVEIVKYDTDIEQICEASYHSLDHIKTCVDSYKYLFHENNFGMHEKICANDCLMNFKYQYEFLSNYDIDEFIFPRHFDPTYQVKVSDLVERFKKEKNCSEIYNNLTVTTRPYSLYDYVKSLQKEYGNKVASFQFPNYLVLTKHDYFLQKIYSNQLTEMNKDISVLSYENPSRNTYLKYEIGSDSQSQRHFNSFKVLGKFVECLNESKLANRLDLSNLWRNSIKSCLKNRAGKSIINTDLTISINPHSVTFVEPGATNQSIIVPDEYGFVSHFRVLDIGTATAENKNNVYWNTIQQLRLDIEYFLFLVKIFG